MLAVNYLQIIDCDAANANESYRKYHRNDERRFVKA